MHWVIAIILGVLVGNIVGLLIVGVIQLRRGHKMVGTIRPSNDRVPDH